MPRRPDILCAGTCGQFIWRGKGVLPEGQSMCRSCRAVQSGKTPRPCPVCATTFMPPRVGTRCCSRRCATILAPPPGRTPVEAPCVECGDVVVGTGVPHRCRPCASERMSANRRRYDSLRRGARPTRSYPMTMTQLGIRDGWRCHLCRKRVDPKLKSPHPMSPTFDHLIPVSEDGDDAPENLSLAHRICNSSRGNRGVVQLLLVG